MPFRYFSPNCTKRKGRANPVRRTPFRLAARISRRAPRTKRDPRSRGGTCTRPWPAHNPGRRSRPGRRRRATGHTGTSPRGPDVSRHGWGRRLPRPILLAAHTFPARLERCEDSFRTHWGDGRYSGGEAYGSFHPVFPNENTAISDQPALRTLSHKPALCEHNGEHLEALPGPSAFVEPVEVSTKEEEASLDIVREVAIREIGFEPPPPRPMILIVVCIRVSISSSSASTRVSSNAPLVASRARASSSIIVIVGSPRERMAGHPIPRRRETGPVCIYRFLNAPPAV